MGAERKPMALCLDFGVRRRSDFDLIVYLMGCALCRRPLPIARCSEILDFGHFWNCFLLVLVPKPIVWQACGLHFGILGGPGTIQEHLGAQERRPWGPGLGF